MPTIVETIAQAIKRADKTFFNENYTKQAQAVVDGLRKAGFEVVPVKPPEVLVEYAVENIPFGRLRPSELIRALYGTMVENCRKFVS
ncbi:hypothetical protein [Nitrospirillum iridis]|uniref:Uncharacterized protein n=1 Tax=Nitrospirillum iridis TaxID=765888 RepID=A0A7X0AT51_9PROT|nr:hypothetical protein [Nitrospirillum iridis]MBB6249637.1 hypothetical protein [Nitrospirillum iridis]